MAAQIKTKNQTHPFNGWRGSPRVLIAFCSIIFMLCIFRVESSPAGDGGQIAAQIAGLKEISGQLHNRLDRLSNDVVEKEIRANFGVLIRTVREKTPGWRSNGMDEYDLAEYRRLYGRLVEGIAFLDMNYAKVHALNDIIRQRIGAMEIVYKGKLNTSYAGEAARKAEFEREDLIHSLMAVYLEALTYPSEQGYEKLKKFAEITAQLADVNRELIENEAEKIRLEEQRFIWGLIPGLGEAMDVAEAYSGTDMFGKKLGWVERGLGFLSGIGAMGDGADLVKLLKLPAGERAILASMAEMSRGLSLSQRQVIRQTYPPGTVEALEQFGQVIGPEYASLGVTAISDVHLNSLQNQSRRLASLPGQSQVRLEEIYPRPMGNAMAIARESVGEQQAARKMIQNLEPETLQRLRKEAMDKMETEAPSLDIAKLVSPENLTDDDYAKLQHSFGLSDQRIAALKKRPDLLPGFIEKKTGVPIRALEAKAKAVLPGEYIVMRNSNPESLRLAKRRPDADFSGVVTKHKDIKGKSGPGGIIPADQSYSKMARKMAEAAALGDTAQITRIQNQMTYANGQVAQSLEKGFARTATVLEGRDVVAVERRIKGTTRMERSLVTQDPDTGRLFDIASGRQLENPDNIRLIRDEAGAPLKVPILVDNNGRPFVADADPHIWGTPKSDGLVDDTGVSGFMTKAEEESLLRQRRAQRDAGLPDMMQHGAQNRAYGLDLPVDDDYYVMENGRIRFVRNAAADGGALKDIVHAHRLNDTLAPIDPTWNWGRYTENGFVREAE